MLTVKTITNNAKRQQYSDDHNSIVKSSEEATCGDVDFKEVSPLVSLISPVPSGVDPTAIVTN